MPNSNGICNTIDTQDLKEAVRLNVNHMPNAHSACTIIADTPESEERIELHVQN